MFKIRAVLAATAVAVWGIYSGYELFETRRPAGHRGVRGQREVPAAPAGLGRGARRRAVAGAWLARLNAIRRENPALHRLAQPALPPGRQRRDAVLVEADAESANTVLVA